MPSIKQVLPTIKNKFVGATSGRPRAFNERPYITKGQRFFVSVLFHTPCLARYSVLHLLGVLSGEGGPPLCKGSLWFVRPESLSAFPYKHCFCGHKSYLLRLLIAVCSNLRNGEIIKYRSVDSTVGFVYNIVTSSGT